MALGLFPCLWSYIVRRYLCTVGLSANFLAWEESPLSYCSRAFRSFLYLMTFFSTILERSFLVGWVFLEFMDLL